jgi:geranylgeranyl diphosphate synthase, type II
MPQVNETAPFNIGAYLEEGRRLVDDRLEACLPPENEYPQIIHRAMRYSLFAGGKRVRPILALAAAEAVAGGRERVLPLACALEMIHTYSLIHDDLPAMDNDDYRRGLPTCHSKFGEGIAILAGNGLMTLAFRLLSEPADAAAEMSGTRLRVIHHLCRAIGTQKGVIAGQVADLTTQGGPFTAADLHYIHSAKTGALIEASVSCAAILCGADDEALARLSRFGLMVGLAFQIVDDILDETGTSAELGKTLGKDRREEKATYPALYGLERSRTEADRLVNEATEVLGVFGPAATPLAEVARFISVRRF